jgi:hypothetical protein
MKKRILFLLLMCVSLFSIAQREIDEDTPHKFKDRFYLGGGFGLNSGTDIYGNGYFFIALNPVIGYMITPKLSSGLGINWQRISYDRPSVTLDQFGLSPFARYNFDQLFAYAEYNYISTPAYNPSRGNYESRAIFNRFLVGLGYSQPIGKRGSINVVGMYDVLYRPEQRIFGSPWVYRVFFSF